MNLYKNYFVMRMVEVDVIPSSFLYDTMSDWGGWSEWSTSAITETVDREVETRVVDVEVSVKEYRYNRTVWYNSLGVFSSSRLAPSGYTQGTPAVGNKKYRMDYSSWLSESNRVSAVWRSDWGCNQYVVFGTIYYTEESRAVTKTVQQTQYRYRDKTYTYHFWKWDSWCGRSVIIGFNNIRTIKLCSGNRQSVFPL